MMNKYETCFYKQRLKLNKRHKDPSCKNCPTCGVLCKRYSAKSPMVRCNNCSKFKGINFVFCWFCLDAWTFDHNCGDGHLNPTQASQVQEILNNCEKITVQYSNVPNVPSLRLCPNCMLLIEHAEQCKEVLCVSCKTSFCFICLSVKPSHGKLACGGYNTPCNVAPIQKLSSLILN